MKSPLMTAKELGLYLRVTQPTIYKLVKAGKLPAFRVGSDFRFHCDAIRAWIERR